MIIYQILQVLACTNVGTRVWSILHIAIEFKMKVLTLSGEVGLECAHLGVRSLNTTDANTCDSIQR